MALWRLAFRRFLSIQWILRLIGLKAVYQIVYLLFVLMTMKTLSVEDYGTYSYLVAMVTYFSAISLFGLPFYIQKNVAQGNVLNGRYFSFPLLSTCVSFFIAYAILPNELSLTQKLSVLIIISYNLLTIIIVAVNDGRSSYITQYKFLIMASVWMMIALIEYFGFHHTLSISQIIRYWVINSSILLIIALWHFSHLLKHKIAIAYLKHANYPFILTELLLMFSITIPDAFAKFYDRFIANHFLDKTFLGNYSFNLMIVATVHAFFIRPINTIFLSNLAAVADSPPKSVQLIKKYYLYTLLMYAGIFSFYSLFSHSLLTFMGLQTYFNTTYLFQISTLNILLYSFAYPFATLLNIHGSHVKKLSYCVLSLLLFNIPLLFITIKPAVSFFLVGFISAYALNLLLALLLVYPFAKSLIISIGKDIMAVFTHIKQRLSVERIS